MATSPTLVILNANGILPTVNGGTGLDVIGGNGVAGKVFMSNAAVAAGAPSFRYLTAADVPLPDLNLSTSTALTGILPATKGGVGTAYADTTALMKAIFSNMYPVGSILLSTSATNPGSYTYGSGTWAAWGTGRVPVGINTGDANFNTVEKTGGEATHVLSVAELAAHNHNHRHSFPGPYQGANGVGTYGGGWVTSNYTDYDATSAGSNAAHNNLQPFITCYMWKRTA